MEVTDVVVPSVFTPYVIEKTAEKSAFFRSGIVGNVPDILSEIAAKGKKGGVINMPFWQDLTGDDEVLKDDASLNAAAIAASQDIAIVNMRGKAWSTNDIAYALAGSDPMMAIGDLVSDYWARKIETTLIYTLTGAMAGANMSGNVYDISSDEVDVISASAMIDACGLLGDAQDSLAGIAIHGATYTKLKKLDLIDFYEDSQQGKPIPTYMGKYVIVDDTLPVSTDTYTSYLFGNGAIGYGEVEPPFATETDRDVLAGNNILANRRHFVLHPRGIAWQGASMAAYAPTNAELATASNWARAYEAKNVKIVQFIHKLA